MDVKKRDYYKDSTVDPNNFEEQCMEQGSIFMYYGEAHADAIELRDKGKQRVELVTAELDDAIRTTWTKKYKDLKMTEAGIKSKILQDPLYKKTLYHLNKATHDVNVLASAMKAMEHKKKSLENLVSLKIGGFFSEPRIKKELEQLGRTEHRKQLKKSRVKRRRD